MSISASFDQLLRGGRVICPASGIDGIRDVAIRNGKIAAVQPDILPTSAREVIDVTGKLVLPGLIDTHAHVYQYVTGRFGMNADMVGVQSGVTTLVDQGGPSCMTLPGFRHFVAEPAKSRVYAFLSAYLVGGLEGHYYPKLYSPDGVDIDATVKSATANLDIVRGIKAHAEIGGFARWGIRVIEMAAEIGRRADLPVYVHFGQLWGLPESGTNGEDVDTILERVIPLLREGDVLAHPFTRHPGGFVNREGEVHPVIQAALDRGLKVDVGHGSHFSYRLAKKAIAAGIVPTTLGADIHGYNTHVPAPAGTPDQHEDDENHPFAGQAKFSLVQAMSSMMALGLTLEQVVPMVTSNPAKMLGRADEIGALKVGMEADVSVIGERSRTIRPSRQREQRSHRRTSAAARVLSPRRHAIRRGGANSPAGGCGVTGSVSPIEENATVRNERDFPSAGGAGAGQGVGARLPRKEDDRLMRGRGQFVADIRLAGLQDVAFVRSPLAHARIRGITGAGAVSRQRLHRGRSGRRQADPRRVCAAGLQDLRATGARDRQGASGRRTRRDVRRADARRSRGHRGGRDARSGRASRRL